MKVMPFNYKITDAANYPKYQPEILIAGFNQALFFAAAFIIFCLARKLFETSVGWVSALVFLASDLFWRFSVSGLPTMLLVVIFLGVVWCLVALEQGAQPLASNEAGSPESPLPEKKRSVSWFIMVAAAAGALVGLGELTLYSFGWLILPTVAFLALYFPQRRIHLSLAALSCS
jgi:4-amino-4-deoxy-L-arabinose transferase-like glycosyltransferase